MRMAVKNISEYGFIGELSLDGRLRACHGILPMIIAAQRNGIKKVIIPVENLKEAKLVQGVPWNQYSFETGSGCS